MYTKMKQFTRPTKALSTLHIHVVSLETKKEAINVRKLNSHGQSLTTDLRLSSSMFHSRETRVKFEVVVLGSQVKSLDA